MWAAATFIDTHLLEGNTEDSSPGSLIAVGGVISFAVMIVLGLILHFVGGEINTKLILPIMLNGALFTAAMWIYFPTTMRTCRRWLRRQNWTKPTADFISNRDLN